MFGRKLAVARLYWCHRAEHYYRWYRATFGRSDCLYNYPIPRWYSCSTDTKEWLIWHPGIVQMRYSGKYRRRKYW